MEYNNQNSGENQGVTENLNLRHYWHVVLERRWLVITAFISVFVLSIIYLVKATPIYEATTVLQINKESTSIMDGATPIVFNSNDQEYLQTQYKNLLSRSLIESVVKDLDLDKDPRYAQSQDVVNAVRDDITVSPVRLSRLVEISVEHPSPRAAAQIANKLLDNFLARNLDQKRERAFQSYQWLETEVDGLQEEVKNSRLAVFRFREKNDMPSLEESQDTVSKALFQASQNYQIANDEAEQAQKAVDEVEKAIREASESGEDLDLSQIPFVANSEIIKTIRANLVIAETDLAALQVKYLEKWPAVIMAKERIATLTQEIQEVAKDEINVLRQQASYQHARAARALDSLKARQVEMNRLNQLKVEYDNLVMEKMQSEQLYTSMLGKTKEMDLNTKDMLQNLAIVDKAFEPVNPVKPRKSLTLILGVIGGLGLGFAFAFFANYMDDSVKSQDDIETYLKLNFLGYIPNIKTNSLVERDMQAHLHPQSNAAEGFRTVRAAISLVHKSDKFKVLSFTSTIPSEGKSLVTSNLAIVTAQTGVKTLLIDADLRRPSMHKAFQMQSPIGISSYLTDQVSDIDEIIQETEVPNLDIICCGAVPNNPSELVGSKRMGELLDAVRGKYDRIFVDCPPVSAVSDPLMIASRTDGIVFVTKFNKIRRDHARKTIQRIQDAGVYILGTVINDIDFEGKDSYYYSYYYYQNRYYASYYSNEKKLEPNKKGKRTAQVDKKKSDSQSEA
jgi:succinoglycan biosynthesis transport protein ExoP